MSKEIDYVILAKKYIRQKPMPAALQAEFKKHGMLEELEEVYQITANMLKENSDAPDGVKMHYKQLLPSIAFYQVLLKKEERREKALAKFEEWCFQKIEKMAKIIMFFMKIPGLYKKVPVIMKKMLNTMFGTKNGFQYEEIHVENGFAVNMLVCPYVETCKRYGCPELTKFFCMSDDICYGNLHPRLVWGRSKTLGMGDECCNFSLYIKRNDE